MKKLILIGVIALLTISVNAQNFFKSVPTFPTVQEKANMISKGITPLDRIVQWRFDATLAITELTWIKATKKFNAQEFSAIGPAVGLQWYRPTSDVDPTPFNIYGVSAAVLLGKNIYNPDLAALKVAVIANLYQYFKAGVTYTPSQVDKFGIVIGGGITF